MLWVIDDDIKNFKNDLIRLEEVANKKEQKKILFNLELIEFH